VGLPLEPFQLLFNFSLLLTVVVLVRSFVWFVYVLRSFGSGYTLLRYFGFNSRLFVVRSSFLRLFRTCGSRCHTVSFHLRSLFVTFGSCYHVHVCGWLPFDVLWIVAFALVMFVCTTFLVHLHVCSFGSFGSSVLVWSLVGSRLDSSLFDLFVISSSALHSVVSLDVQFMRLDTVSFWFIIVGLVVALVYIDCSAFCYDLFHVRVYRLLVRSRCRLPLLYVLR